MMKPAETTNPEVVFDTPEPPSQPTGKSKINSGVIIAVSVGALLIGGGGGYVLGVASSSNDTSASSRMGAGGAMSQSGQNGGIMNGNMGTVTTVSSDSISVKEERRNTTETFTVSSDTKVTNNGSSANINDIKVGDIVRIETASNNSKAASSIERNPTMDGPSRSQSGNQNGSTNTNTNSGTPANGSNT